MCRLPAKAHRHSQISPGTHFCCVQRTTEVMLVLVLRESIYFFAKICAKTIFIPAPGFLDLWLFTSKRTPDRQTEGRSVRRNAISGPHYCAALVAYSINNNKAGAWCSSQDSIRRTRTGTRVATYFDDDDDSRYDQHEDRAFLDPISDFTVTALHAFIPTQTYCSKTADSGHIEFRKNANISVLAHTFVRRYSTEQTTSNNCKTAFSPGVESVATPSSATITRK